jgi:hypothetical protein
MAAALCDRPMTHVADLADDYAETFVREVGLPASLAPALSGTLLSFLLDAVRMVQAHE